MFEDLSKETILKAIQSLGKKGDKENHDYSVWYKGNLISPAAIITEAYILEGNIIARDSFNTDNAQAFLLKNGFPIVGNAKRNKGFFSEKELNTFKTIVARHSYDPANPLDQNIGLFLKNVAWSKTKLWADKIKEVGWKVSGTSHWNEQRRNKTGQGYKQYTWYRIFPEPRINDLIYFTIGIHGEDATLVIKLDIERNNDFFKGENLKHFEKRKKELDADWLSISAEDADNIPLDQLVKTSLNYFYKNLDNYYRIASELWPDKRLMRVTWNNNNWEFPSPHKWRKQNQGKKNIAHENQYGFGHEEWLFNPRYRINEYQYGFIQGIQQMSESGVYLSEIKLFGIKDKTAERYLVAILRNVEIIDQNEKEQNIINPVIRKYFDQMAEELKQAGADFRYFAKHGYNVNIRFKWKDAEIFREPLLIEGMDIHLHRFQPYKLDNELDKSLKVIKPAENVLHFNPGKGKSKKTYEKQTEGGKSNVTRSHTNITDDIELYLRQIFKFNNDQISIEKSTIGTSEIDILIKDSEEYIFFEVKTKSKAILNIREALGQLFEYAFRDPNIKIKKLVIVGPAELQPDELEYFNTLKKLIKKPFEYWAYSFGVNKLADKFRIYS